MSEAKNLKLIARNRTCHANTTLGFVGPDGHFVAIGDVDGHGQPSEESEQYARRLVACWNAFEGAEIDLIECVPALGTATLPYRILQVRSNALQKSMQALLEFMDPSELDEDVPALRNARAALKAFTAPRTEL